MDILILEDEILVARHIEELVTRVAPDAQVKGLLSSVEETRQWFGRNKMPDLILADIHLSDGVSFDIFESLSITCPIIFVTAYDQFAIRAFKLNSIDYLLKPIDMEELSRAIIKYRSVNHSVINDVLKSFLVNRGNSEKRYKERFLVIHGSALVPVQQNEVAFFHKEQLIFLYNFNNEKYLCEYDALDEIEELLDPKVFFRVNRQYIVHIQAVGKVKATSKGLTILLKTPHHVEIDISREKAAAFKRWLN